MKLSPETLEIISSIVAINSGSPVQGAVFKKGNQWQNTAVGTAPISNALVKRN